MLVMIAPAFAMLRNAMSSPYFVYEADASAETCTSYPSSRPRQRPSGNAAGSAAQPRSDPGGPAWFHWDYSSIFRDVLILRALFERAGQARRWATAVNCRSRGRYASLQF